MQRTTKLIIGMLVIGWMGSAAHAQVVLNMPPPKSQPAKTVVKSSPGPSDTPSIESQPSQTVRVGDVALARYRRARSLPRDDYGYGGRFWQPYGYNYGYSYGYGYYPNYIGFGNFTFGHHSHHQHDMGMGDGH